METKDMLKEVLLKYKGPLGQLLTNLAGDDGEEVLIELKKFNRKEPCYATVNMHLESKMNAGAKIKADKKTNVASLGTDGKKVGVHTGSILRCISEGGNFVIRGSSGHLMICNAKKTFDSIDCKFKMLNTSIATLETPVEVYEVTRDYTFLKIFSALPGAWNEKWLSQNQIVDFCEEYPDWLAQHGFCTMFLIKKIETELVDENNPANNLAVVRVFVQEEGLLVGFFSLTNASFWLVLGAGEDHDRVVAPKLLPLAI